jgi:hypothetical protein
MSGLHFALAASCSRLPVAVFGTVSPCDPQPVRTASETIAPVTHMRRMRRVIPIVSFRPVRRHELASSVHSVEQGGSQGYRAPHHPTQGAHL